MDNPYGGAGAWALCCLITVVFILPEFVKEIEHLWRKPWFGYWLVTAGVCIFFWFTWHVPPSGYAITAMAVVAGVMALRQDMGGREKWLWFALLLAFMVVEIRAINKDRAAQEGNFTKIATRLETAILGLQESIRTLTGGDSFPEILAEQPNQQGCVRLSINAVGNYDLIEANVVVLHTQGMHSETLIRQEFPMISHHTVQQLQECIYPTGNIDGFQVNVTAHNGDFVEALTLRKNEKGKWLQDVHISDWHGHVFLDYKQTTIR